MYFSPLINQHIHTLILVSGATGFLGAHMVCQLLQNGKRVRAMHRGTSSLKDFEKIYHTYFNESDSLQNLSWVHADVLDIPSLEQAFIGIHEVYHCAATVSFLQKDKTMMMKVNEEGTANMVNMSLLNQVRKFCHVSSIAAIGREHSNTQVHENIKWTASKLNSNYALSKYKAEMQAWRGAEEGLQVVIVNPGVILGVCDWNRGSGKFFDMVWKQMPFYTNGVNGYVDVQDVTRAMHALMEQNKFSNRFILVGKNMANKDLLHNIAHLLNRKPASIKVTPLLAELAWIFSGIKAAFTGKDQAITKETARASLNIFHYSTEKIERELDFKFTPIEQTLSYICEHFLKDQQS